MQVRAQQSKSKLASGAAASSLQTSEVTISPRSRTNIKNQNYLAASREGSQELSKTTVINSNTVNASSKPTGATVQVKNPLSKFLLAESARNQKKSTQQK